MTVRCVQSSTVLGRSVLGTSEKGFTLDYGSVTLLYDDPREAQHDLDKMAAGVAHLWRLERLAAGQPVFSPDFAEPLVGATAAGDL